eukprot:1159388-Pelagomonas_calceolata.AAC.18
MGSSGDLAKKVSAHSWASSECEQGYWVDISLNVTQLCFTENVPRLICALLQRVSHYVIVYWKSKTTVSLPGQIKC